MSKLDENISKFVHSEGKFSEPSLSSYMQSLKENLEKMEAKSMREARRIEMAKENLAGIRRQSRRLEERLTLAENQNKELQERLSILEETTEPK